MRSRRYVPKVQALRYFRLLANILLLVSTVDFVKAELELTVVGNQPVLEIFLGPSWKGLYYDSTPKNRRHTFESGPLAIPIGAILPGILKIGADMRSVSPVLP